MGPEDCGLCKSGGIQVGHTIRTCVARQLFMTLKLPEQTRSHRGRHHNARRSRRGIASLSQLGPGAVAAMGWQATRRGRLGDAHTKCEYLQEATHQCTGSVAKLTR